MTDLSIDSEKTPAENVIDDITTGQVQQATPPQSEAGENAQAESQPEGQAQSQAQSRSCCRRLETCQTQCAAMANVERRTGRLYTTQEEKECDVTAARRKRLRRRGRTVWETTAEGGPGSSVLHGALGKALPVRIMLQECGRQVGKGENAHAHIEM